MYIHTLIIIFLSTTPRKSPGTARGSPGTAKGEPGYGEGGHKIENMLSADIGLATNQPARGSGLGGLDSSYDANEELFKITYIGVWKQK